MHRVRLHACHCLYERLIVRWTIWYIKKGTAALHFKKEFQLQLHNLHTFSGVLPKLVIFINSQLEKLQKCVIKIDIMVKSMCQ